MLIGYFQINKNIINNKQNHSNENSKPLIDIIRGVFVWIHIKEKKTHDTSVRLSDLAVPGSDIDEQEYITFEGNQVKKIDTDVYVKKITRMKPTPAFDALSLESPENEELFAWIDKLAQ